MEEREEMGRGVRKVKKGGGGGRMGREVGWFRNGHNYTHSNGNGDRIVWVSS